MIIRKATVLGAGVMGSQIAALLVNAGLKVELLDVVIDQENPNKLSKAGYDRITNPKKSMLFNSDHAANLTYGNYTEQLSEKSDSDIFIEAVKEDVEIKHEVWSTVAKVAKENAILATNTSGIPINVIAKVFSEEDKQRFVGLHFFNPPRFMKLVEVIPNTETSEEVIEQVTKFTEDTLGKGVIHAKDVPAFVANRTGTHAMSDIMFRGEKEGYSIAEIDALTGKVIGRPMGTYALADLVGLDVAMFVVGGLMRDPSEQPFFNQTELIGQLYKEGALGNKTKHGFYKKENKKKLVINPETMEYTEISKPELEILEKFGRDLKENMDIIFNAEEGAGKLLWETLRSTFYYAAHNVPKATDDYKEIDRAMVWGFNWKKGPFQLWDLMGYERVKERIQEELGDLPDWVANREEPFYEKGEILEKTTPIQEFIAEDIWNREDSRLSKTKNNQLLFKFQTPNNTITDGLSQDIIDAVDELENKEYTSMVIYSPGPNFSVGANLYMMKMAIEQDKVDELVEATISELHEAVNRIRYTTKPIVTATQGRALGGGAEILLASPAVVAAAESYIGLVEVGVGLVPGGGGLAELAERVSTGPDQKANKIKTMSEVVTRVASAEVAMNAYEAQRHLYLKESDTIIANGDKRVEVALEKADFLSRTNYIPRPKVTFEALGEDFKALVEGQLEAMRLGHFISDYDMEIGLAVAEILAGGLVPKRTSVNQDWIQHLEKENFIRLSKNQKTYERISHMLTKKKPLRN